MSQPLPHDAPKLTSDAAPRATAYSWYVLAVLTLVYVSNHIDRQILAILIGPIKQEIEWVLKKNEKHEYAGPHRVLGRFYHKLAHAGNGEP